MKYLGSAAFLSYCDWRRSTTKTVTARVHAPADATIQGQWLRLRSTRGPRTAINTLAMSGRAGISQSRSPMISDMAGLPWLRRLDPRGGQAGHGHFGRRLGQGLLVHGRRLAGLAQLLPEAYVERMPAAVEH